MIFMTGGAGYIGTHTVVELLYAGHEVTVATSLRSSQ
jgi:UDP-glucose 4-epimerase